MAKTGTFTLKEVAEKLGVHPATVVRWIDTRKVRLRKKKNSSGHIILTNADLKRLLQHRTAIRPAE